MRILEIEKLFEHGIPFEIVPGVTSATAAATYAGIPITHREYTSSVAFITGHEDPTKEGSDIAWEKLATGVGTLVFLMGVGNLPKIAENLIHHGRSGDTPVAVIRRGTVTDQKTITGPLKEIAELAKKAKIKPPAVIVVGDIVHLRRQLNWFETRPLFGRRIVVTRAREQVLSEMITDLAESKADLVERCGVSPSVIDGLVKAGTLEPCLLPPPALLGAPEADFAPASLSDSQEQAASRIRASVVKASFAGNSFEMGIYFQQLIVVHDIAHKTQRK